MVVNEISGHEAVREYEAVAESPRAQKREREQSVKPADSVSENHPPVADRVDISQKGGTEAGQENETAYDYDVPEDRRLVVKIVDREDRAEVIRQYPSERELAFIKAYRNFMELIGL